VPHVFRRHAGSKQVMGFRRFMFHGVTKGTSLRCLEHAPAAGAGRSGGL